ncbi:MAG: sulfite exporter TauE/SafE family protein [Alphaproteobacteria bacterium]
MSYADVTTQVLVLGALVLFGAGMVKGTFGAGLPMLSVPLIATLSDPLTGIAMLAVPVLVTNIVQLVQTGRWRESLIRFWPMLVPMAIVTIPAARLLTALDPTDATKVLGFVLMVVVASQLLPIRSALSPRLERWLAPVAGVLAGLLNGVSSIVGPIVFAWMVLLRLDKEAFIASVCVFFFVSGVPLYGSLALAGVYDGWLGWATLAALAPALAGMAIGTRLRGYLSEKTFRRALTALLFVVALNLLRRGFDVF